MHQSACSVRRMPRFSSFAATAILCAAAQPAAASDWIEPRNQDAGEFVAFAQVPVGIGELETITGVLDGPVNPGFGQPPGVPDFQDLFMIQIVTPSAFTARTVPFGFADIDTELYLFDLSGFGLLNNDNELGPPNFFSRIVPMATDGTFTLTTPGFYVIGVAAAGNIPTSAGGPIFAKSNSLEVSGPDGPGGAMPHTGWITNEVNGRYVIELTGTAYVPAPGAGAAMLLATLAGSRRRRR